jgi:apolipoprotein D and lipocalin family protein
MKILFLILYIFSASLFAQTSTPTTVDYVDLKEYAGLWYEIAKIPNSFQDHCMRGTTAEYSLKSNGEIAVINSCIDEDGDVDEADGVARVIDKKTNAKLEVSFVSFLGWRPFWGDYWIIGLYDDYQWAVVGHPERKFGWILSRIKQPDEKTMNRIFEILKNRGYNPADFEMTLHKE